MRKLYKFLETTLDFFTQGSTSNLTQKWLDDRYANESEITFHSATYYKFKDFLETVFFAKSSYGATSFIGAASVPNAPNGYYVLVLRFYKVKKFLKDATKADYQTLENALTQAMHQCDVKFYSDDPSFFYQSVWQDLEDEHLSIFKFPGPRGDGTWTNRHAASGGLRNPKIHLTKHLSQLVQNIDSYVSNIAKNLKTA